MVNASGKPLSQKVHELLKIEDAYAVGAFAPVPGFIVSGKGSTLVDVDGTEIIDFICMMSATNLGHCHPAVVQAVVDSVQKITLTNLATHSNEWPYVAKELCQRFGYDKVATMVTGAEAADTACKIARKWGVKRKGIAPDDVLILGCSDNYHGLTSGIWPIMNPGAQAEYALTSKTTTNCNPRTGELLRYGHVEDFEAVLNDTHDRVAAIILECIHGQLPTFEQELQFSIELRKLCKKHNILFIADEIRMGCAKTGRFLCSDWMGPENKPDMITIGKSITGGVFPASYILGNDEVMTLVGAFEVGSTFAMAPAANAATMAALQVYDKERLADRALVIGEKLKSVTASWKHPFLDYVTNRGADLCIMVKQDSGSVTARRIARLAYQKGLLVFPHNLRIRASVALTITDAQLDKGLSILTHVMDHIQSYGEIPGSLHPADDV